MTGTLLLWTHHHQMLWEIDQRFHLFPGLIGLITLASGDCGGFHTWHVVLWSESKSDCSHHPLQCRSDFTLTQFYQTLVHLHSSYITNMHTTWYKTESGSKYCVFSFINLVLICATNLSTLLLYGLLYVCCTKVDFCYLQTDSFEETAN